MNTMVVLPPPKIVRAVVAVVWRAIPFFAVLCLPSGEDVLGEKVLNESVRFSKNMTRASDVLLRTDCKIVLLFVRTRNWYTTSSPRSESFIVWAYSIVKLRAVGSSFDKL